MTDKEQHRSVKSHKSLVHVDLEALHNNSLNDSVSKMQYSFPKSPRFIEDKNIIKTHFYDIQGTLSKRGTSLGYGNKLDLSSHQDNPSPAMYNMKSEFELSKSKGITLALGRSNIKSNSMFINDAGKYPSPLSYSPKHEQKGISYSMRPKFEDNSDHWVKKVPGPGSYNSINPTNQKCTNFVSKFESAPTAKFSILPRLVKEVNPESPGPGRYDTNKQLVSLSKFQIPKVNKFGSSKRRGLSDSVGQTPGPGAYSHFSEFL